MNKKLITLCVTIFGGAGSYVPVLLGDASFFDGWSVLGGLVGGLFGIWVGAKLSKRY